jgi:phosphonate metabolism protein PhnN/1,5-bisphosphokinase (PRPP-forming)
VTATGERAVSANQGVLFYVVGAPAAGKHRLLTEARDELAGDRSVVFAHRYVTRAVGAGRNDEIELTQAEFLARASRRLFAMHWERAGVRYGVGMEINYWLAIGLRVVVKGSRAYLPQALAAYPEMTVLWLGSGLDGSEPAGARLSPEFRRAQADACAGADRTRAGNPVIYLDCSGALSRTRGLVSVLTSPARP